MACSRALIAHRSASGRGATLGAPGAAPAASPSLVSPRLTPDTLIAFDTSTERMAVAVQCGGQRFTEDAPGGAAASAALLPTLQALLAHARRGMSDVAAIAFGRGPGAFTGLRTSCAVAQGLALALARPVLPIDSLLIVAEQARRQAALRADFEIGVAIDARMGEVYAARYRWQAGADAEAGADADGRWSVGEAAALWAPRALAARWGQAPPDRCTGSALALFDAELQACCPRALRLEAGTARAAALLALAASALQDGAGLDAAEALPLYLRDKVALTTAERAQAAAAAAAAAR